jgi:hypothetical protein
MQAGRQALVKRPNAAHSALMAAPEIRECKCGALYGRTFVIADTRDVGSFECLLCGETLDSWHSAWVPKYRLIVGPVRKPSA